MDALSDSYSDSIGQEGLRYKHQGAALQIAAISGRVKELGTRYLTRPGASLFASFENILELARHLIQ